MLSFENRWIDEEMYFVLFVKLKNYWIDFLNFRLFFNHEQLMNRDLVIRVEVIDSVRLYSYNKTTNEKDLFINPSRLKIKSKINNIHSSILQIDKENVELTRCIPQFFKVKKKTENSKDWSINSGILEIKLKILSHLNSLTAHQNLSNSFMMTFVSAQILNEFGLESRKVTCKSGC
jgi:hypothetical protein